ncbi:MAG: hypothetical protein JWR13_4727, partial [Mycobacterium sp.]|nr:hypothetical protein [Mycobacterium sp.]
MPTGQSAAAAAGAVAVAVVVVFATLGAVVETGERPGWR